MTTVLPPPGNGPDFLPEHGAAAALGSLRGRRVLLTGATGFLGSHLLRLLRSAGVETHAASRSLVPGSEPGLTRWSVDLCDRSEAERLVHLARPDVVFHLAGHSSGAPGLDQVAPTLQKDLITCVNVLAAATSMGAGRLVMTGSLTEPPPDVAEPIPSSPYAAAKWAGTAYGRMFHAVYGLPVVIVRLFMGYGPGQPPGKLIPTILRALLQSEPPRLASGRQEFDWTYVDDLVEGLVAAAVAPDVEGRTLEVGTGRLTSVREIAERLVELVGTSVRPAFGALPDRPPERPRAALTEQTRLSIGWEARIPLEEGLLRTVASFKARGGPAP